MYNIKCNTVSSFERIGIYKSILSDQECKSTEKSIELECRTFALIGLGIDQYNCVCSMPLWVQPEK